MTDDTVTGWKTRALRAWAWLLAHPVVLWVGAGFIAGAILPRIVVGVLT